MSPDNNKTTEVLMRLLEGSGRVEAKLENIEKAIIKQQKDTVKLEERIKDLENKESKRAGIFIVIIFIVTLGVPFLKELFLR